MSVIHRYTQPLYDAEGRAFLAEAHGEPGEAGLWEGWIEFVGLGRAVVLRTAVETRQSGRRALAYWASGIRPGYLEGALARATRARLEAFRT